MSRMSQARRAVLVSIAVTAVLAGAACSGGHTTKKSASTSASVSPPTSSAATSAPPKPAAKNPFTGFGAVPTTPVIAVKIDDTEPGRPQVGIDKADIVYLEAVEAGLTRLAAVFGTNKPTAVGYVRSTRPSDPDLLLQFGKITEAYSGGAGVSLRLVRKAGLNGYSNDAGRAYFHRVSRSQSTYINVVLNLQSVAKHVRTPRPKSIGWTFAASIAGLPVARGTDIRTTVTGSYPSGTAVEFRWDARLKKYVRYIGGVRQFAADGKPVTATNVIVQSCRIVSYPADRDVNGFPAQFTYTVGTGPVSVFRDGKRIDGTWSRANLGSGTTLRTTTGKPLPLAPGNTWVVLIRKGVPVSG
jgi:Protein of unknown function (DUF3048) N-terminal domain/Protein of unknown function (DUF3048) C-terminal domain